MTPRDASPGRRTAPRAQRSVVARLVRGEGTPREVRLDATFTMGSAADCALRVQGPDVAAHHVQIVFDGARCWARDLGSAAGTWVDGARVEFVPLGGAARVELGAGGPLVSLEVAGEGGATLPAGRAAPREPVTEVAQRPAPAPRFASETQIVERYLRPSAGRPAGRETMMFQRAFARVRRQSVRRYRVAVAAVAVALVVAGGVIAYQAQRLRAMRATAERLFYAAKAVELQTAKLEDLALARADPAVVAELAARRAQLAKMDQEYDAFVQELGLYERRPDDERVILRVGRRFGECDVNMPRGFVGEVRRYVERWRGNDRLAHALDRSRRRGYARGVGRVFAASNLPPQYLFLAIQESGLDERAVGPPTRFGYAKGMWQFIPATARRYGLRVGPLHGEPAFDADDERFEWEKATAAAARYLRDLHSTEAQGSGLLAMASYNWGEEKVRGIIAAMPHNPQERNFWRLLANRNVPHETYDYVLSIFSAAAICEEPRAFGFQVECPALQDGVAAGDKR